jgi:cold shock CspA family protein/ribosome-associated translation inhibitor RaiA
MEIHWHDADSIPEAERNDVTEQLEALAADHTDLIDVWVDVEENTHHRHGGDEVAIRCQVRGGQIVSRRKADEAGLALREALAAFEREVREWRRRRTDVRSEPPASPPRLGIVDRVFRDDGYGFLLTDGGERVYFHQNALTRGLSMESLREGDRVGLDYEAGEKGLQAVFVEPAPPAAPSP